MQIVSQAWKNAQKLHIVPESFVEVSLDVGDPQAQADASASVNGEERFSDAASVVKEIEKKPVKYATLETGIWLLNGAFSLVPSTPPYGENGYVGSIFSGDDARFTEIPTITISFSRVFTNLIPGIMVTWGSAYGEYASAFRVTAYNGGTAVAQTEVTGNRSVTSIVNLDIENYDRIVVEILEWSLPRHRPRIEQLSIGMKKRYTKTELMSYSHSMFVDALSASLPKAEISFQIVNLNGEYNPDNPSGVEKYLMERQRVESRYGYKLGDEIEYIDAGVFFLSEWETPQNGISASFTARDSLEYMSDKFTGPSTGTLSEIATAALVQAALPLTSEGTERWTLDASLADITVPEGVDLSNNSIAEVLQYCAHAGCCVFYQDRKGVIHIEKLADSVTAYEINRFNSFANSEISLTKPLKAVDVNNGQYIHTVASGGETQPINNPLISADRAPEVAQWAADYLVNRKTLSGEFRSDPRLDALDRVTNENQFARSTVLVTEINYSYNGAFRGSYEGRADV